VWSLNRLFFSPSLLIGVWRSNLATEIEIERC
jgi:hypothetical protein